MKKTGIPALTNVELKIMGVLWEKDAPVTIQEISAALKAEKLSPASVTQAMNRLVAKGGAAVHEHVLVSNVYARTFRPCFDRETYLGAELSRLQKSVWGSGKRNVTALVAALLEDDGEEAMTEEEVEELERLIRERKRRG